MTWSTDLLLAFPTWYSAFEIPMFLGLAYIAARLKFDGESPRDVVSASQGKALKTN